MKRLFSTNMTFFLLIAAAVGAPFFLGDAMSGMNTYQQLIIGEVLYAVIALAAALIWDRQRLFVIQQAPLSGHSLLRIFIIGLLIQPVMQWLNLFSMLFTENAVSGTLAGLGGSDLYNLLYVALAPAVAEEFIFRGLIYHGYRQGGVRRAAVLSGFLFGLLHLNLNQFVYAFALGTVLALLLEACGSIYATMIIHFMINARSVIILAAYKAAGSDLSELAGAQAVVDQSYIRTALLVYTPIALICCVGIFFLMRRLAAGCGRGEYFDLVLQGQEQSVFRKESASEEAVRTSREKMEAQCGDVLEKRDAEGGSGEGTPMSRAARFAPQPDETLQNMSRSSRVLISLPLWIGIAGSILYMALTAL